MIKCMFSLTVVIVLSLLAFVGAETAGFKAQFLFGVVIPYTALLVFVIGAINRVIGWARSPVPFAIPTTAGQQKSLPWIKPANLDNPTTTGGVFGRMFLEVFLFRSLFRNTKTQLSEGPKISFNLEIFLWLAALAFHASFFAVLARHLRLFTEPVPFAIRMLEKVDGMMQVGVPGIMLSGFVLLAAVSYLLIRRIIIPQVKYISLIQDYFPLFLIIGIAASGILMRHIFKIDVIGAKQLAMGLVTFHPVIPEGIGGIFYVHIFFVSVLLAYFPFSKLMHMGGIFMSPTRNLPGNTRAVRHVNPWNYPVHIHTYEEYEDEFREKMIDAGLPVEKE
ncbi:sulfate reduction electron transfer complex DsrMKJOP subunit DsrM [Desulfobacterium sp. N47]|uniref:Hdr-like menaquinol oxidoreductase cytochrome b-like subunit n=1 Tax=uncultured Desulfobacterium sp. TaxID=201089 RepID=E1Y9C3_9BACT|nr:Hdr-like menaquinol oxidoreductase cytochrome b-like subunit [uncultured Desulfobacterium sp.]